MKTLPHRPPGMPSCEAAVERLTIQCADLSASAEVALFRNANRTAEYHIMVRLHDSADAGSLMDAYQRALSAVGLPESSAVFRRVFCSDVVNQSETLDSLFAAAPCAFSKIGQPPLPAAKFALWAYHLHFPDPATLAVANGPTLSFQRGPLTHHWSAGLTDHSDPRSRHQTQHVLEHQDTWLHSQHMHMADHVVRTWWFVQNIDADYQGLVDARRDHFEKNGLTSDTHYIASTGIAGAHPDVAARVSLDSYAIGGLQPSQLEFLNATDHLCPTSLYGVTFERATAVSYSDRRHIFISGTASIDTRGQIVHPGDVLSQLARTLENIEALLAKAGANLGDLASIIVYLRDPADGHRIEAALREKMGPVPYVMVHAPVCRPGWLIEIEGIAIVPANLPHLPEF